ncbi:hypothetical protein FSHL1_007385 [Fusarium sambucinum]
MADHIIVIDDDDENEIPPPVQENWHRQTRALTFLDLCALSTLVYDLSAVTSTTMTTADFRRFLDNIFDGWQSNEPVSEFPMLPERRFNDTRIQVERRAGKPVFFGLGLNYETGVIDWAWRDKKNAGISPQYARLDDGYDSITICTQAILYYDQAERVRIRTYNSNAGAIASPAGDAA